MPTILIRSFYHEIETKAAPEVFDLDSTSWEGYSDSLLGKYQTICMDTHYSTKGVSTEEAHGMYCPVTETLPVYDM